MPSERPLTLMKLLLMAVSMVKQPPRQSSWKKGMEGHHSSFSSKRITGPAVTNRPAMMGSVMNAVKRMVLR